MKQGPIFLIHNLSYSAPFESAFSIFGVKFFWSASMRNLNRFTHKRKLPECNRSNWNWFDRNGSGSPTGVLRELSRTDREIR